MIRGRHICRLKKSGRLRRVNKGTAGFCPKSKFTRTSLNPSFGVSKVSRQAAAASREYLAHLASLRWSARNRTDTSASSRSSSRGSSTGTASKGERRRVGRDRKKFATWKSRRQSRSSETRDFSTSARNAHLLPFQVITSASIWPILAGQVDMEACIPGRIANHFATLPTGATFSPSKRI